MTATAIGAYATTALFKELAGITASDDDTLIGKICDRGNQVLESEMGQVVAPISSATYLYDGNGLKRLYLPLPPASMPGIGIVAEPALMGSREIPSGFANTGPPVSVCHMWSITGTWSSKTFFCNHSHAGAFNTSPAQNTFFTDDLSNFFVSSSPVRISNRAAVGDVKILET